jgi:hypothetical protein
MTRNVLHVRGQVDRKDFKIFAGLKFLSEEGGDGTDRQCYCPRRASTVLPFFYSPLDASFIPQEPEKESLQNSEVINQCFWSSLQLKLAPQLDVVEKMQNLIFY